MRDRLNRLLSYLAADPQNPQLLDEITDLQLQLGLWRDAQALLQRQLETDPGNPTARYRLAVVRRANGDADLARLMLTELVDEGHGNPAVLQELARVQAQQGDWQAALDTLAPLKTETLPTEEADTVHLLRVRALHHLGDVQAGLAEAEAWRRVRGTELPTQGLAAVATLHLDGEELDSAAELVARASPEQVEDNAELAAAAGFVQLSQGHAEAARALLSRSASKQPSLGRAHLGLGLAAAYGGDLAGAVQALQAAVTVMPEHLGSWHALAWMQMLGRDLAGAESSLQAALAQDANFGETHGGLALLAALRGDQAAAVAHVRTGARLDPKGINITVARIALERNGTMLDARVLEPALQRFLGLAATRSPAMQALMTRMLPQHH
jgi:tetratricopeptide (TPR) repeat protein